MKIKTNIKEKMHAEILKMLEDSHYTLSHMVSIMIDTFETQISNLDFDKNGKVTAIFPEFQYQISGDDIDDSLSIKKISDGDLKWGTIEDIKKKVCLNNSKNIKAFIRKNKKIPLETTNGANQ